MQSKISLAVGVIFAALIVFGLVGSIASPHSVIPAAILVFTILGWASARIVNEGTAAAKTLIELIIKPSAGQGDDAQDDGDDTL